MFFVVVVVVFLNERGVRRVFCMPEGDSSTGFSCKQKQQNVCVCVCAFIFVLLLYSYYGVTIKRQ